MRSGSGFFLLGILALVQFRFVPLPGPFIVIALSIILLSYRFRILRFFSWYICGFLWACLVAVNVLGNQLSAEMEGQQMVVSGHVTSLPSISDHFIQSDFQIDELYDNKESKQ